LDVHDSKLAVKFLGNPLSKLAVKFLGNPLSIDLEKKKLDVFCTSEPVLNPAHFWDSISDLCLKWWYKIVLFVGPGCL
jgi:hypothetical protein